jgi:hypothetical protein
VAPEGRKVIRAPKVPLACKARKELRVPPVLRVLRAFKGRRGR